MSAQDAFKGDGFYEKAVSVLATWFGTGLIPLAPGTFGTLAAMPLVMIIDGFGIISRILSLVIVTALAFWASDRYQARSAQDDPHEVVIDEVAGFLLTMFLIKATLSALVLGFVFFRFFDILKPYPIRYAEKLKGGVGIVMDDLLAGLYALLSVRLCLYFMDRIF